jgi:glycine/D-amino acid oxidase-like deaminating enzyme
LNLHNGKFFWPTTYRNAPSYPMLEEDITCDVVIIGAGGSGAQCAHFLSLFDINVVVVEKRLVGLGSTVVNTALLQYIGDKMFHQLANSFGESQAVLHHQLCKNAIDEIEKLSRSLHKSPHFHRRDSLFYASSNQDITLLNKEYELLKKYNFPCEWLTEETIQNRYSFKKPAAISTLDDGEINPYIYTHGLIHKCAKRGVKVFEQTEIVGEKLEGEVATLYTNNKKSIKAKHVIFASGYESLEHKAEKNTTIESSYAVFTNQLSDEQLAPWYKRSLIWETARPYLYIRTTNDNRVVIGGLDETTPNAEDRDSKINHKRDSLIQAFNNLFPSMKVYPDFYYGAFYGGTHDGLPMVGIYDDYPNCYFLLGFGDNGIVYSNVLSKIISELILKGKSKHLDLYLQTRPIKKARKS